MKSMGYVSFSDLDRAFDFLFRDELCTVSIMKGILSKYPGIPQPESSTKDYLFEHIVNYIRKNYPKDNLYTKFTELIMEANASARSRRELGRVLAEPETEADLKPIMKKALEEELGYTSYDREVNIDPGTRADVVAYKRKHESFEEKKWLVLKETWQETYYEFIGVELKTAKRSKDPLYRQASIYTDYFDYSYTAITPLTMLERGYNEINRLYKELRAKGMGIVLIDSHRVVGTILLPRQKNPKESNRKNLTRQLGLVK